ncbi:MAG: efflux RND transporter periplasmic adaptor subunit [Pseudomonadota bacterium]
MRSFFKFFSVLCLIVIIAVAAFVYIKYWRSQHNTVNNNLYTVAYGNISETVSASGTVAPQREAVINAFYDGYVKKIYVKTGQHVKAGDPLVSVVESLQAGQQVFPMIAPYAGQVMIINKNEGEDVLKTTTSDATNTDYIMKIADLSHYYVDAKVPEMNIAQIKKGQQVTIKVISIANKTYKGVVDIIASAPMPQQNSFASQQVLYPVHIRIENPDHALRIGMSAVADIAISHKNHVLLLPHDFLHEHHNSYYVVLKDGKTVPVTTGLQNSSEVEITKGLTAGQQVRRINFFNAAAD